jgi:outer membrane receptor protein involved in Fe transport
LHSQSSVRRAARAGLISLTVLALASAAGGAWAQSQTPDPQTPAATPQPSPTPPDDGSAKKPAAKPPAKPDKARHDKPAASAVEGVTVTADTGGVRTSIDRRSYDITKDLQATNGAPIADALRNLPSVDVDLNGAVTLRGQSGVTIMVDGKPSTLFSGPGGAQALLQIPADQYERVEVMTNPSAAFSPDGTAGIINLISKKHQKLGSFGSVTGRLGPDGRENGGVNGTFKTDKITASLGVGGGRSPFIQSGHGETESFDATGAPLSSNLSRLSNSGQSTYTYGRGSVQWNPDSKTQITGEVNGFKFGGAAHPDDQITVEDGTGAVQQVLDNNGRADFNGYGVTGDLSLRRDFAGDDHNLTVSLNRDRNVFDQAELYTNTSLTPPLPPTFQKTDTDTIETNTEFKGDYKRPMPLKAQLSTGWDVRQETDLTDASGFLAGARPTGPNDPSQTDRYHFQRQISALYATYQQPIGKFTVMGGLRVEQTHLDIDDQTSHIQARSNDLHLYPTLHLAYDLTDAQQILLSYSERVQRPGPSQFDPFRRESSPFSFSQGNPDLKPEQTQDFEAGYQYRAGGQFYVATVYYKLNTGGVSGITTSLGDGVYLTTQQNLTQSRDAGLELVASGHLSKTLSYNLSGNVYWNQIDASALGFITPRSGTTIAGRGSVTWQATPADTFQLNGFASGRQFTPQGYTERGPNLNLGYQHKLNDHIMLVATAQNLLGDKPNRTVFDTPILRGETEFVGKNQVLYLGLRWTFGAGPKQRAPDFDFSEGGGPH